VRQRTELKAKNILSNALAGTLGYLAGKGGATPTVGLALTAETAAYSTEFNCEGTEVRTSGKLMGVLTEDINVVLTHPKLTLKQTAGVQERTSFEGGLAGEDTLRTEVKTTPAGAWEPAGGAASGLEFTASTKQRDVEVKA
jgi:hypothetical protein